MFGIGNLLDPTKLIGTNLFGPPKGLSGSPQWGNIASPGGPSLHNGMSPQQPLSLLKADEPIAQGPTGGAGLLKAGMEDVSIPPAGGPSRGVTIDDSPPMPGVVPSTLGPGTGDKPLPGTAPPGATPSNAPPPGVTTPSLSPQYTPTAPQPGETGGGLYKPYDAPRPAATPPASAGPGGAAGAPGAAAPTTGGGMGKLGDVGKALASAGGKSGAGGVSGHTPGGMQGDPAAASRAGAAGLLESVIKANTPIVPGPVPGLPPGILQRFRGG